MRWYHRSQNIRITLFVIVWTLIFHYESTRHFYLNPIFKMDLPKIKFLFPPIGWIMFFNVNDSYGMAEVYGIKNGKAQLIDPHTIFQTRAIGYDNIHRNDLSGMLYTQKEASFCRFLKRKFPDCEGFLVTAVYYPSVVKEPGRKLTRILYRCP